MCGVALKHAGHTVTIVERDNNERMSHMAGVCLGLDAVRFLERHDRHTKVFSHRATRVQALKDDETVQIYANGRREITSWDTYYFRLRSLFDGYASSYYPSPPASLDTDGLVKYQYCSEVTEMARSGDKMVLTILNRDTQAVSQQKADLVVGADGPSSFVRSLYLPAVQRQYVGYIAWRGTVPESEASAATRAIFHRSVTVHMMKQHHCIMYMIPGPNGSLEPGERLLNFLWYTNETPESVDEIMKDGVDGHRHHHIVPAGRVRQDIWQERIEHAKSVPFAKPFLEIMLKIQKPFIQVITEFCTPQAAFEDGKVLLMGDALSLFRPHTAFSGTQAAFHALRIEEYVAGKIPLPEWEEKVLRYSYLHFAQSIWWGKIYQHHISIALLAGVNYWASCGVDKVKSWWSGEESLLRTTSFIVEEYD